MYRSASKILAGIELDRRLAQWRFWGEKIVFTNGCFDILHLGHITYLETAATLGDILLVGVNSDASVRRLKGDKRPILDQQARMRVLAALEFVEGVILFEEDTPQQLIEKIRPAVLVKGGDYDRKDIVGADFVEGYGGEVIILPLVEGYSTTQIFEKACGG
ncbi:MAG: D-glycero-beta-D-manno-heptose 1-phosphate adenylyltransferase [Bacteroidia bacterium]